MYDPSALTRRLPPPAVNQELTLSWRYVVLTLCSSPPAVDQELTLWRCLMTLLADDEADVRDAAAEVVDALDTDDETMQSPDGEDRFVDRPCWSFLVEGTRHFFNNPSGYYSMETYSCK